MPERKAAIQLNSSSNGGLQCITLFSFPLQLFHIIGYASYNSPQQRDPSLTSTFFKKIPSSPFYPIVVQILCQYQLPLTSLFLASRPTHTFPNTSQSFACIEQLLPRHCSHVFLYCASFKRNDSNVSSEYKSSPLRHATENTQTDSSRPSSPIPRV